MGCKYACVCYGCCISCSRYEPEQYYGHAEDILAQSKGFNNDEEYSAYLQHQNENDEYDRIQDENYSEFLNNQD